ncbi:MAG: hypothetical protein JSW11_00450 [Candidatus Heimdallarchaeota archaeon]|nr:MAG: hypothetical protein JSW11_00450 [Candidatus Heimdallarchaeota archaeon]
MIVLSVWVGPSLWNCTIYYYRRQNIKREFRQSHYIMCEGCRNCNRPLCRFIPKGKLATQYSIMCPYCGIKSVFNRPVRCIYSDYPLPDYPKNIFESLEEE